MITAAIVAVTGCGAIKTAAIKSIADTLSSGSGDVFTRDDDPLLVRHAVLFRPEDQRGAARVDSRLRRAAEVDVRRLHLIEVTRAALPMLGILGIGLLLITYVPWLTLGLLGWMRRL